MKKIMIMMISLLLAASLCACGGDSEGNGATGGGTLKNVAYYEEYSSLPSFDSITSSKKTGSSTSSINGVVSEIKYNYSATDTNSAIDKYLKYLSDNGFAVVIDSEGRNVIVENGVKVAVVSVSGTSIVLNILPENERTEMIEPKTIKVGDTIELDFMKLTLNEFYIDDYLYPHDTSGVYLYIDDTENSKYVIIKGVIKNTSTENISGDNVDITFSINNKFNYTGELIITANPSSTTDYAITPFEESYCFIYAGIPDEALDLLNEGLVTIKFNDNFARGKEYKYIYYLPFTK